MSKNAPKIILIVVCLGAAAFLVFWNMNSGGSNSATNAGQTQNAADQTGEQATDEATEEEATLPGGLTPDPF